MQGAYSVAIGSLAGVCQQAQSTIIINATGSTLNGVPAQTCSFYVNPIRGISTAGSTALYYCSSTKEVTAGPAAGGVTTWATLGDKNNVNGPTEIALGYLAGSAGQGFGAVAIGWQAGGTETYQGPGSVAIGPNTGSGGMGDNSIAIGNGAGNPTTGSITISALGYGIGGLEAGLYIAPVRNDTGNTSQAVYYNVTTNELTYAPATGGTYNQNLNNTDSVTFNNLSVTSTLTAATLLIGQSGVGTVQSGNDLALKAVGNITANAPFVLPSYTTAGLSTIPSPVVGSMVFVTDATGGAQPCYYAGTHWYTVNGRIQVA
jgi:hypothetical protein